MEVALEQDTVRLSQLQMSQLFDTSPLTFFQNIFRKEELSEEATAKESLVVRQEGKRQVRNRVTETRL
ncbi:hypothetical protein [Allohahella sp. A8]|uniref:hypothetical protein n=1 Tax=Allohahella sp. A8 TaxID=3141461 RepID=UPI003A7F6EBC